MSHEQKNKTHLCSFIEIKKEMPFQKIVKLFYTDCRNHHLSSNTTFCATGAQEVGKVVWMETNWVAGKNKINIFTLSEFHKLSLGASGFSL